MKAMNISRENFQNEVLKADRPVLLDFWAPWWWTNSRSLQARSA